MLQERQSVQAKQLEESAKEPDIEKARRIVQEHQTKLEDENKVRSAREHSILSEESGMI